MRFPGYHILRQCNIQNNKNDYTRSIYIRKGRCEFEPQKGEIGQEIYAEAIPETM